MRNAILKALAAAAAGLLAASLFLLPAAGGSPAFTGTNRKAQKRAPASRDPKPASIVYVNSQYGFRFALPASWKGYTIAVSEWTGFNPDAPPADENAPPQQKGPILSIVHPLSTKENPRQNIPIMVFRIGQWELIEKEQLAVGAAPIPPTELGRNAKFVFALPARYNFEDAPGADEVAKILEKNPLHAF